MIQFSISKTSLGTENSWTTFASPMPPFGDISTIATVAAVHEYPRHIILGTAQDKTDELSVQKCLSIKQAPAPAPTGSAG